MSALMAEPDPGLAALGPDEFAELIRASLGRDADPALWDALTSRPLINRTRTCLGSILTDLGTQLQRAGDELDEYRAECMTRGEDGKADFFAARGEHAEWRGRLAGYRRLVERRMAFVKSRIERPVPVPYGEGFTKNARKHNRAALEKLASAVAGHRRRVTSGDGGEDDDEALWACLEDITAITSSGEELPLGEWLEYLDDRREAGDGGAATGQEN